MKLLAILDSKRDPRWTLLVVPDSYGLYQMMYAIELAVNS